MSKRKLEEKEKESEERLKGQQDTHNEEIEEEDYEEEGEDISKDISVSQQTFREINKTEDQLNLDHLIQKDGSTENKNAIYQTGKINPEKPEDQEELYDHLYPLCRTSTDCFGKYGVGIQLYFKYLKAMILLLFIMTLVSIPALVSNLRGGYYNGRNKSQLDFTMFGNQVGFDHEKSTDYNGRPVDQYLIICSDMINTVIFFIFVMTFKYICTRLIVKVLRDTQTSSDYTIYVTGFPTNGLTGYLENNENNETKRSVKYLTKIKVEFERQLIVEHFSHYGKIEEVVFARRFGNMMKDYMRQDNLNKEIIKQEVKTKILAENANIDQNEALKNNKSLLKLKMKDNKMEEEIRNKYPDIKSYDDLPLLGAFIVFDDPESCNQCYDDYIISNKYKYQQRLKLADRYNLNIEHADEPVNIKWENLEVGRCESFWRSSVAIIITILLLIVTFIIVFGLRTSLYSLSDPDNCEQYSKYTPTTVNRSDNNAVDCVCMKAGFTKNISNSEYKDLCRSYLYNYLLRTLITVVVSFLVSVINFFIRVTFRKLSSFERFKNVTDEKEAIFKKLFISVFINMSILLLQKDSK